jgi:Helix-turn-helix
MDAADFSQVRRQLGKTQAQMARLLGVSAKAVQSFEQGWRNIPAHVERHLLFLLCLKRLSLEGGVPCWDQRGCTPDMRRHCMAWETGAGHLCWFVNGTVCQGSVQDSWEEKMQLCRQCEVFRSLVATRDGN